mgnify:CR=1 FL=1
MNGILVVNKPKDYYEFLKNEKSVKEIILKKKNDCNRLITRAGLDWNTKMKMDTLFIYECNYDFRIYGWLYDVL